MTNKKNIGILLLLLLGVCSCVKNPAGNGDYLQFKSVTLNVSNKQGASAMAIVKANITWQLSIQNPQPDWMVIDKFAGTNDDSIIVTTTKNNITGGYKYANIIATPINNNVVQPVRLTIVQYDSSNKGK